MNWRSSATNRTGRAASADDGPDDIKIAEKK